MTFSMHSVVLLRSTMTMNHHWKTYHHLRTMPPNPQDNASQHNSILSGDWGHDRICFWWQLNVSNQKARFHSDLDVNSGNDINLQLFDGLLPKDYLQQVVLVETNKKLEESLTFGELLRWIGVWVLMSMVDGSD